MFRLLVPLVLTLSIAAGVFAQAPAPLTAPSTSSSAVGDLLIAPTRLVLEGSRRSAEITLVNIGTTPATYRISLTHLRMKKDGTVEEFTDPASNDHVADSLIRFSPRQVTLQPRIAQVVRIQIRKPADLPPGEYRSHLLFRGVPPTEEASAPGEEPKALSIRLIPVYGVSIPLIVRNGETAVRSTLRDLLLMPGEQGKAQFYLQVTLNREGNRSVYGNVRVTAVRNDAEVPVGALDGVAVYEDVPSRSVLIPLNPDKDVRLNGTRLRVAYYDAEKDETEERVLAEAVLDVP